MSSNHRKTLQDLRREADAACRRADWIGALRRYRAILQGAPDDLDVRLLTADALAAVGERDLSADVYRAAAWSYVRTGYPLRAVVAARALEKLTGVDDDLVDAITTIFADGSSRIARIGARATPAALTEREAPVTSVLLAGPAREVARSAWAQARGVAGPADTPSKFAPAPILSDLAADVAVTMVRASRLRRARPGEVLARPSAEQGSILLIARGQVELTMATARGTCAVGTIGEGSLLGHEPFVGGGPVRTTAVAQDDVDAIEIPPEALREASERSPEAGGVLGRTLRAELLQSVLRTSPLFRGFPVRKRVDLLRRMQSCRFEAGSYVLRQGSTSKGTYLLLSGEVRILVGEGSAETHVLTLAAGDIVGLTSTAYDGIATASAVAVKETTMMFLPADAVRRLVAAYPVLGQELSAEAVSRAHEVQRASMAVAASRDSIRKRW
ncbi:MAG: cyclic nucleotide-binding domain-containing protein [Deltaproteobacteria bacterium]|nr:cyclic nucleotide-binding domain-containing protein [Deltaproteobacteria bacterium]